MQTVKILGTDYKIFLRGFKEDPLFEKRSIDGYCDDVAKEIVICRISTYPGYEEENPEYCQKMERQTLRHEVIHAFLSESGLEHSSLQYSGGWAKNEEMVDYFALQFPKLLSVFRELNCLE